MYGSVDEMWGPEAQGKLTLYFLWERWSRIPSFRVHGNFIEHNSHEPGELTVLGWQMTLRNSAAKPSPS